MKTIKDQHLVAKEAREGEGGGVDQTGKLIRT